MSEARGLNIHSVSSVAQSCLTLCDPVDCITNSRSLRKLMSIESVMPSNHLILCCPLLLPPSVFPSIRVFSNESVLHIRWPKYWSFIRFLKFCNFQENLPNTNIQWTHFPLPFKLPFLGHSQLTLFRVSYVISFS